LSLSSLVSLDRSGFNTPVETLNRAASAIALLLDALCCDL